MKLEKKRIKKINKKKVVEAVIEPKAKLIGEINTRQSIC
jgi:hypothetical protein